MPFHEHSSGDSLLVMRQSQLYCNYGLGKSQDFVDTHIDVGKFQQPFQFLIDFQGHEANTDVRLDASSCEVEYRTYLDFGFGYSESPLHMPQIVVGSIHL